MHLQIAQTRDCSDTATPIIACSEDLPEHFDCDEFFKVRVGEDVTWREAQRATAAYYGMIEWVDRQYGRVIAKLEELNVEAHLPD